MYRCSIIKAEALCSAAQCGTNLISTRATSKKHVLSGDASSIRLVTNHSALCFSWLLPPNILVKMMMSDRDFYISPQLASHPCFLSTFTIGGGLTHAHQSLTSPFPLPLPARNPPPLCLQTHRPVATSVTASRHHSQCPFSAVQLQTKTRHNKLN